MKIRALLLTLSVLIVPGLFADTVRVPLWPAGKIPDFRSYQHGVTGREYREKGRTKEEQQMPHLVWFAPPAKPNGGCVIVAGGGGYKHLGDEGVVESRARELTALGFQCVNLSYRTPRPSGLPIYQSAWQDGQRAVRLVRAAAKTRGFDPEKIGFVGCSASSHLGVMLATSSLTPAYARIDELDDLPCSIAWVIAGAPAYATLGGASGDPAPQDGTSVAEPKINPCFKFDAKTCPISFHHGGADVYSPNGSTLCYRGLRRLKVPAELHLYADLWHDGAHGFAQGLEFLRQMGFVSPLDPEENLLDRYASDEARAEVIREKLWPEGKTPDLQANQKKEPWLEWHLPKKLTTKAIQIIYSGGSYFCSSPESFDTTPARRFLNKKGMTVVTLNYRVPRGEPKHLSAWQDLQRAIRIVRSEAASRGLDPDSIGLMGSSAGGHLTLMGVTSSTKAAYQPIDEIDKLPCNVQWGIAVYPAYVLTDGEDGENKFGGNRDEDKIVADFAFDEKTVPMCFIHGDADGFSAMGSVKVWEKMRTMGIQCDLHTLARRAHCFQKKASPGTGSYTYLERIWEFLLHKKFLAPKENATPRK